MIKGSKMNTGQTAEIEHIESRAREELPSGSFNVCVCVRSCLISFLIFFFFMGRRHISECHYKHAEQYILMIECYPVTF